MAVKTIPGIRRIQMVRCAHLPHNTALTSAAGIEPVILAEASDVTFFSIPTLSVEGRMLGGERIETATLQFTSADCLPEGENLAFVVTTASGTQHLVGAREPKYPVIEYDYNTGAPGRVSAVRSYKITHTAIRAGVECVL